PSTALFLCIQRTDRVVKGEYEMDKTGVASLIGGIILLALGAYAVWVFLPDVITVLKGSIGIIAIIIGIFLVIFGAILIKD
ncbi:MAG TPA: hypothetical protein PKL35_03230, partial [Methanoregulaceae archaeon]|nr:hypothetical protein [Methanoregulaceae archaeon]